MKKYRYIKECCFRCGREYYNNIYTNNALCKECRKTPTEKREKGKRIKIKKRSNKDIEQHRFEYLKLQTEHLVRELIEDGLKTDNVVYGIVLDYRNLGIISDETRNIVFERDQYRCRICGSKKNLEIHHRIKRRNGGDHTPDNLILLCQICHRYIDTCDYDYAVNRCIENVIKNNSSLCTNDINPELSLSMMESAFPRLMDKYRDDMVICALLDEIMDDLEKLANDYV